MKKFMSIATWDPCHGFYKNQTTDTHETKGQAEAVCKLLKKEGLGGEKIHFPIKTYIEEICPPHTWERSNHCPTGCYCTLCGTFEKE